MLNLYNSITGALVDENWLIDQTSSADLILVYGISGSGYDIVVRAMRDSLPYIDWASSIKLADSELNSGLKVEFVSPRPSPRPSDRVCWYLDDIESTEKGRKLDALIDALNYDARVLGFLHATNALTRLKSIYLNSDRRSYGADIDEILAQKMVAQISVKRFKKNGDVFIEVL